MRHLTDQWRRSSRTNVLIGEKSLSRHPYKNQSNEILSYSARSRLCDIRVNDIVSARYLLKKEYNMEVHNEDI